MLLKPTVVMVAYPHSKPILGACVTNFEIYTTDCFKYNTTSRRLS